MSGAEPFIDEKRQDDAFDPRRLRGGHPRPRSLAIRALRDRSRVV